MAGIAGIAGRMDRELVRDMLGRLAHRGPAGRQIVEGAGGTLGAVWADAQANEPDPVLNGLTVQDVAADGHLARASLTGGQIMLTRDPVGIAPLYYGHDEDGALCFSSEVKGLLGVVESVHELPPGHRYDGESLEAYREIGARPTLRDGSDAIAAELYRRLDAGVAACIGCDGVAGSWLSGGLDSSTMVALASRHARELHTFAVGLAGSPDLAYAREMAAFVGARHHELVVTIDDLLEVLPVAIYHLESFDALLVRSSVTNYLVAGLAAEHVGNVFSGEGGDELFAGYAYLSELPREDLAGELLDITRSLHNTALQRVDRSASAHGLVAHTVFLSADVLDYALQIPISLKLRAGVEKWILRQAMAGLLPEGVLRRAKSKFWEGAGVGDLFALHAESQIGDDAFEAERRLPNGWLLNSKEELMYYRLFRAHLGEMQDLSWMGRTKGAPRE